MSITFKILFVFAALFAQLVFGYYDNPACSDFGPWQEGCAGPGSVACVVPYESGAYCISRCYSNTCSYSKDAAAGFKKHICESFGYAADYITAENNEVHLAIHRNKSPSCGSYERTFDFVPYAAWYSETAASRGNEKIPK